MEVINKLLNFIKRIFRKKEKINKKRKLTKTQKKIRDSHLYDSNLQDFLKLQEVYRTHKTIEKMFKEEEE